MTTKITNKILTFAIASTAFIGVSKVQAQTNVPNEINFQAIARDASDNIVQNSNVQVYFDVIDSTSGNVATLLRQLIYQRPTDNFGQFSLTLAESGPGFVGSNGSTPLGQISWASGNKWIRISYQAVINGPTYNLGSVKAGTTFYAFHSRTAENITLPATNGQVLKYNSTSNKWEAGADNNTTYTAGNGIAINGSNVVSATDASATNELQTLTQTGNTVTLSNSGGSVNVDPSITNELPTAGAGISVSGNTVSVKSVNDYAVYEERYASTVIPSNPTNSNSWNQRNLNYTQDSSGTSISRNGGFITLTPGKYYIKAFTTAFAVSLHKLCLKDVSNNIKLIGSSQYAWTGGVTNTSELEGYITVNTTQLYKLDHYITTSAGQLGNATTVPNVPEVYSRIHIQKIQ